MAAGSVAIWGVAFSPDGTLVASGSADRTVRVWDLASGREIRRFVDHTQRVWGIAFSPNGQFDVYRLLAPCADDSIPVATPTT